MASSSSLEVGQASEKMAQLMSLNRELCSSLSQQQCRKKGQVQSGGGDVHAEGMEVSFERFQNSWSFAEPRVSLL